MKKFLLVFVFALLLIFPVCTFAQTAMIIDINGDVLVKKNSQSDWEKAGTGVSLDKNAELKTQMGSECTLVFDEERQSVVTIKENTQIRIDSIKPGNVYLPKGRVFSLIKNLSKIEKFQIRTPTAIAGARGTGWETGFGEGKSSVMCFDDTVYVSGLDANGNITEEEDLDSGFGLEVGAGGKLGDSFEIGDDARAEWNDFTNNVVNFGGVVTDQGEGTGERGALQDLRDEGRENYREEIAQEQREENQEAREEAISESPSENKTGGEYAVTGPPPS